MTLSGPECLEVQVLGVLLLLWCICSLSHRNGLLMKKLYDFDEIKDWFQSFCVLCKHIPTLLNNVWVTKLILGYFCFYSGGVTRIDLVCTKMFCQMMVSIIRENISETCICIFVNFWSTILEYELKRWYTKERKNKFSFLWNYQNRLRWSRSWKAGNKSALGTCLVTFFICSAFSCSVWVRMYIGFLSPRNWIV